MRSKGYSTWSVCLCVCVCVCVCVCMSVTQHLTFLFIHATSNTNLLGGGLRLKIFKRISLKMFHCEARAFPVGTAYGSPNDFSMIEVILDLHLTVQPSVFETQCT